VGGDELSEGVGGDQGCVAVGDDDVALAQFLRVDLLQGVGGALGLSLIDDLGAAFEVGGEVGVAATFEAGRQTAEKLSAVQYVRFPLAAEARRRITDGAPLALAAAHPNYRAPALLPEAVRASLAADLADPAAAEEALRRVRDGG